MTYRRSTLSTPAAPKCGFVVHRSIVAGAAAIVIAGVLGLADLSAQLRSGASVNIVGGPASVVLVDPSNPNSKILKIVGDPYLRSQNEPSIACSTKNPQ